MLSYREEEIIWKKSRLLKLIDVAEDVIQRSRSAILDLGKDYPSARKLASVKRRTLDLNDVGVEIRKGYCKILKEEKERGS